MEHVCTPRCHSPPGPPPATPLLSVQALGAEMHEVLGRERCRFSRSTGHRHRHHWKRSAVGVGAKRRHGRLDPVQLGSAGMPVPMDQKTNGPVTGNTLLPQNKLKLSDGYLAVGISRDASLINCPYSTGGDATTFCSQSLKHARNAV